MKLIKRGTRTRTDTHTHRHTHRHTQNASLKETHACQFTIPPNLVHARLRFLRFVNQTEGQHSYSLYLMSATYLGLDQQVPFRFTCVHGEERDVVDDDDDDEGEQGSARSSGRTKANSAKLQPTPAAFPSLSEVTQPQKKQLAPEHKQ